MEHIHEYLVVGAGPAGLQLGYYLERDGRDYLILEQDDVPGAFFKTFPRHRKLISINKIHTGSNDPEFNMRHDWNSLLTDDHGHLFRDYDQEFFPHPDNLLTYLGDFAEKYHLKIRYRTKIVNVAREEGLYALRDTQGNRFTCKYLVIATGVSKPYIPPIPGIEHAEVYNTVSVDLDDFTNQRVLILGKGNSGFETADYLTPAASVIHIASPSPLKMAWKIHYVGHLRAVNNNFLDTYQLKSQNAVLDARISKIEKLGDEFEVTVHYAHAEGEVEHLRYDRVICCTGFQIDASIFSPDCMPRLTINDRFPEQTSEWESTNQKNMYFAGTLTQMRDFKKATSGFIHGFRYNVQALYRIFAEKHHQAPPIYTKVAREPMNLVSQVLARVNRSGALWQQPGFLGDWVEVHDGGEARYYQAMPVDFIREKAQASHFFIVTMQYGEMPEGDVFRIHRIARDNVDKSEESVFLHPVVREYRDGVLVSEHHIIEDLAACWDEPEHIEPLRAYFKERLAAGHPMAMA